MRLPATLFALLLTTAAASAETPEQPKDLALPMPVAADVAKCLHLGCPRETDDALYYRISDLAQQQAEAAKAAAGAKAAPAPEQKPAPASAKPADAH